MRHLMNRDRYLQKLLKRRGNGQIKVITGIRRCGKSYLLFNLFRNHLLDEGVPASNIITLALDDDEHDKLRDPRKLGTFLRERIAGLSGKITILLDEITEMALPLQAKLLRVLQEKEVERLGWDYMCRMGHGNG